MEDTDDCESLGLLLFCFVFGCTGVCALGFVLGRRTRYHLRGVYTPALVRVLSNGLWLPNRIRKSCLSPLVLLWQNTTDWVICKWQEFISHSSGGWEAQDQGAERVGDWWGLRSCFQDGALLPHLLGGEGCVLTWWKGRRVKHCVTSLS
jgi:hypothetical protein